MKLSKRQSKIIFEIINSEATTQYSLSENLNISNKTIAKELDKLNIFFSQYDTSIIYKDKKGIRIESAYPKHDLINIINDNKDMAIEDEIVLLLLLKDKVSISSLESKLFISKHTIKKIILENKDKYDLLKLDNDYYSSNLLPIRKIEALLDIIKDYVDTINYQKHFKNIIRDLDIVWDTEWFEYDVFTKLDNAQMYIDSSIKQFYLLKNFQFYFGLDDSVINDINVLRYQDARTPKIINDSMLNIFLICKRELENFIHIDDIELEPLVMHIYDMISSDLVYTNNEIYIFSKYLKEFENKNPLTQKISENIFRELNEVYANKIRDYELYFIVLYIQVLFENRNKHNKEKILIICEYGVSLSNYLAVMLESKIDLDMQITTTSFSNFEKNKDKFTDFNIVVTTIQNFSIDNKKVIKISPLMTDLEIKEIKNAIVKNKNNKLLSELLTTHDIKVIDNTNREEIIDIIQEDLKEHITDSYIDTLRDRDKKDMVIVDKIIFPHGNPKEVINSKIKVYVLNESVNWNDYPIDLIIVNCWNTDFIVNNQRFIKHFYRMFTDEKKIGKFLNTKNVEDLYKEFYD